MQKQINSLKGLTLDPQVLKSLNLRNFSEIQSPVPSFTTRCRYLGVNIRHPYICKRCRRFKLQGFYGSFPPKNFCICSPDQPNSFCKSPLPLRLPSKTSKYFLATGTAIQGKVQELGNDLPDLSHSKSKQTVFPRFSMLKEHANGLESSSIENNINEKQGFKFLVFAGNNSKLVKKILLDKTDWVEGNYLNLFEANFIWQPVLKNMIFRKLGSETSPQYLNHFEYHSELSQKFNLYQNLSAYCQEHNIDLNALIPASFALDLKSKKLNFQVNSFKSFFRAVQKQDLKVSKTHYSGANIWLIKPSENNRGRGIQIFNSISSFKSIMTDLISGKASKKSRRGTYIIQKYIESPLLINSRKFDIRVWVLVTNELKCYWYKEGYIRTSSNEFSIEDSSLSDNFIHLTNNAVQKESVEYSKYEKGNQISFEDFEKIFNGQQGFDFENIKSEIKKEMRICLNSVLNKLNPNSRTGCFEIFGFDFIVDSEFSVWLIECNTNPCIELSSPLLERIIPDMLSEAFEITVPEFKTSGKSGWEELIDE